MLRGSNAAFAEIRAFFLCVALLFAASAQLRPAYAEDKKEKPLVPCNQHDPYSVGSIFYDFDALIVYYRDFMGLAGSPEQAEKFPKILKNKTFNDRLLKEIKKNFALCLKTADGKDKPIYVIYEHPLGDEGCDGKAIICKPSFDQRQMTRDPRNLTLILRGHYVPVYEIAPDINGIGYIQSYWFRPAASYFAHEPWPSSVNTLTVSLPPLNGIQTIEEILGNYFFPYLVPARAYPMPSDLVSPFPTER